MTPKGSPNNYYGVRKNDVWDAGVHFARVSANIGEEIKQKSVPDRVNYILSLTTRVRLPSDGKVHAVNADRAHRVLDLLGQEDDFSPDEIHAMREDLNARELAGATSVTDEEQAQKVLEAQLLAEELRASEANMAALKEELCRLIQMNICPYPDLVIDKLELSEFFIYGNKGSRLHCDVSFTDDGNTKTKKVGIQLSTFHGERRARVVFLRGGGSGEFLLEDHKV